MKKFATKLQYYLYNMETANPFPILNHVSTIFLVNIIINFFDSSIYEKTIIILTSCLIFSVVEYSLKV